MFRFLPEEFVALDKSPLSPVYAETFVYTPAKHEANLGQLYMAAEVFSNKSQKENAQLISEIASVIKNEYYKNTIVTPISALRFGLKRANMFLAAKKNWLSPAAGLKIKVVAAVLKERNLHLAKLGEATALILRNDNLQHIIPPASNAARVATSSTAAPDAAASWAFENIVSGELMENDTVVLATNQIHRIDEHELVYKLKKKELVKYLKNSGEGIKSLALVALYPKKDAPVSPSSPLSPVLPPFTPFDGKKGKWLKPVILVLILLAVAAGVGAVAVKIKKETAQNKKEAETLVQEVSDLKEKIADLIEVKNETEANELLATAAKKLSRLEELGLFKTTFSTLSQELIQTAGSLLKQETIKNISSVLALGSNSNGFDPETISLGRNKIFIFGGNTLYKFDLNRQTGSFESLESGAAITGVMEKPDDPNTTFIATQDKIMVYGNSPEPRTAWFRTENQPAMNRITLYRESFYMLGEDGLIYRLPFSTSSTTSEIIAGDFTPWNKDQATSDKRQVTSFTVEGSIFGLSDEHTLVELANGQKKNEIVLKEAIQEIFTLSNHKNIYALSPADGLIVILDKNLNTKKRLFHPELAGAGSFVVNSQERVVYFLKDKTIYSFEI